MTRTGPLTRETGDSRRSLRGAGGGAAPPATPGGDGPTAPETQPDVARITYMYLRWLLVLLPAFLFVVTVLTSIQQGRLEESISAYYAGPVRDVFVGVLIATAACLVAYQGASLVEDYTLNGAGFYAVFVALVPTNLADNLRKLEVSEGADGITPADYVWFLRIALTAVLVLCAWLVVVEFRRSERFKTLWNIHGMNKVFVILTAGVLVAFLGLAMWQLWVPAPGAVRMEGFEVFGVQVRIHDLAALFFMAALAVAVWSHGWPERAAVQEGETAEASDLAVRHRYQLIFAAMLVGPLVVWGVGAALGSRHIIIYVEWLEILLFSLFWFMETRRIGDAGSA
jgi:hypothetical protein